MKLAGGRVCLARVLVFTCSYGFWRDPLYQVIRYSLFMPYRLSWKMDRKILSYSDVTTQTSLKQKKDFGKKIFFI